MSIDLSRRQRRFVAYSIPVLAVFAALLFGAVMLILLGADPIEGYSEMFLGAFGSGDALIATGLGGPRQISSSIATSGVSWSAATRSSHRVSTNQINMSPTITAPKNARLNRIRFFIVASPFREAM